MATSSDFTRFTLDLPRDLHRSLRLYAVENEMHASEICRELLRGFLASKTVGDQAVEAAIYRRGYKSGTDAERERIVNAVFPSDSTQRAGGLPTKPPGLRENNPHAKKVDRLTPHPG